MSIDDNNFWVPNIEESTNLYNNFQKEYPIERIEKMSIEEYTNTTKKSFCYTLEFGLKDLGSIKGSNSYKFGIYKYNQRPKDNSSYPFDDTYTWVYKYGTTSSEAFINIKEKIIEIARAAKEMNLDKIESVDISNMFKWKIAFLYSDYRLLNIFSEDSLRFLSKEYGLKNSDTATFSEMYTFLLNHRDGENIFTFSSQLWNKWLIHGKKIDKINNFWAVGAAFNSEESDMTDYFIENNIWYDNYAANNDNRNEKNLNEVNNGDIFLIKSSATKGVNHDITFTRLKAIGKVINKKDNYTFNINWLKIDDLPKDFNNISYRKTIEKMRDDEMLKYAMNIIDNNNTQKQIMESQDYNNYINLLLKNHNIILTGAPGTGKTYSAKEIAKGMGCNEDSIGFVQFHPSYDYTDFVEGLRPIKDENGNIGFERKNGVFKEFCRKAIENNYKKRFPITKVSDKTFETVYKSLVDDIKNGSITRYETGRGIDTLKVENDNIYYRKISPRPESKENIRLMYNYFLNKNIWDLSNYSKDDYWNLISELTNNRTKTIDYIEYGWTLQILLNRAKDYINSNNANTPKESDDIQLPSSQKPFVFIIDEINRGEISKIFGELFYCIDPGYRGEKGKIKTQYQNLVEDNDIFYEGFYIPENVYIIGTMNDIDRSVESMDFAFRRRFAFVEIKANENIDMLNDIKDNELRAQAIKRLKNLNNAISQIEYLSPAYHIGASYFLKINDYDGDFEQLWNYHLEGLLREYMRGMNNVEENVNKLKRAYELTDTFTDESDSNN